MENKRLNSTIRILAFGIIAEKMQTSTVIAENISDTEALKMWLAINYPNLKNLKITIAVNKQIVHSKTILSDGCEVALLPPFSGG